MVVGAGKRAEGIFLPGESKDTHHISLLGHKTTTIAWLLTLCQEKTYTGTSGTNSSRSAGPMVPSASPLHFTPGTQGERILITQRHGRHPELRKPPISGIFLHCSTNHLRPKPSSAQQHSLFFPAAVEEAGPLKAGLFASDPEDRRDSHNESHQIFHQKEDQVWVTHLGNLEKEKEEEKVTLGLSSAAYRSPWIKQSWLFPILLCLASMAG